jgi:DNA-binding transcriptional ArsR family regulator
VTGNDTFEAESPDRVTFDTAKIGEIAQELELTRQNVSNHLTCLRDCGIVVAEPEGRHHRYEIADAHLAKALDDLVGVVLAVDVFAPCNDEACTVPGCCEATS